MDHELILRLAVFLGLLAALLGLERLVPRRPPLAQTGPRRVTNLAMLVIGSLALRAMALLLPALAIGAALDAERQGWGLFNQLDGPVWAEGVVAILLLDFAIWAQHVVTHRVPVLWRFHRVHHADRDMDVTTGLRFHPVEIMGSMAVKIGLVYLLGPAAWAVLAFEILLNGTSLFTHANIRLPQAVDRIARRVIVTPDMHRIHHSPRRAEHDSNFGFALSLWDHLFGTYRALPEGGMKDMAVGLEWQGQDPGKLGWALWLPFRR